MKIYTRRGDAGETDLFGGPRVGKDDLRVEAYGAVDELNACLGLCRAASEHDDLREMLEDIQSRLFDLGGALATPSAAHREKSGVPEPQPEDVARLEAHIDALEGELAPLERFILPGGGVASGHFHVARTVCRRAERRAVALARADEVPEPSMRYLNRLSDLLFVMARVENRRAGIDDLEWVGIDR